VRTGLTSSTAISSASIANSAMLATSAMVMAAGTYHRLAILPGAGGRGRQGWVTAGERRR
jgi:hypothetical protein